MVATPSQPASSAVIAVFDIGKTNKKLFVFDEGYHVVFEKQVSLLETVDEDGEPCEDLAALTDFVGQSLAGLAGSSVFDLKAVNFSAYGSSLVYLGEDGKPLTPLYNYLKPYPDALIRRFYKMYGGKTLLSKKSACQVEGSLNAGLQLYRLKQERPEIFKRTTQALFLPQWLSFLFSGKTYTELTSIGCHTGMWDFEKKDYLPWVRSEGALAKLPPIVPGDTLMPAQLEGRSLSVGAGLHDSSSALVAYQALYKEPFVLISTGTWCVSMNPVANGLLTADELNAGGCCYLSANGRPVKASRRMLGKEYEMGKPIDQVIKEQIESTRMVIEDSTKQIFVDGGFAQNEQYMQGLRDGFSGLVVRAAKLPHASALGAAMMMKKIFLIGLLSIAGRGLFAQEQGPPIFSRASWISYPLAEDSVHPCPVFRKSFNFHKRIRSAILFITAHGMYEARIGDKRVSRDYFTPGFTSYDKRLQYQEYYVTQLVRKSNEIQVTVGDGWWRGVFGGDLKNNRYGRDASLLFQLDIVYTDGTKETIVSDSSWRVARSNILYSNLYHGEIYDAGKKTDSGVVVSVGDFSKDNLVPAISEAVSRREVFRPVKIFKDNRGEQIIDFGQNLAGWVQIKIRGRAGDTIKLFHAEALDKDSNFYRGNLRAAKAADIYIEKEGEQTLEPHFTYHGFRYVKAEGFTATKENCRAISLYSNLTPMGSFSCSNPLINQLQHNITWSLNSNFVDIPTDCPQRSERLGWSGDAEIFCRTAAFNRYIKNFFSKWLADLVADQGVNGAVPRIIPDIYHHTDSVKSGVAGWGDAATIVPWTLYEVYGDTSILRRQYESMKAWVDYMAHSSKDDLWTATTYGDWYAPGDSTSTAYIDQCFFFYSATLVAKAAGVLRKDEDAAAYGRLAERVREAFLNAYSRFDTRATRTQTAYILALAFDLLPEEAWGPIADSLVARIASNNDHLATGFLGTPYLLPVLTRFGHPDLAYTLLEQKTVPSWLYPITKGATTIWEKWDAIKPDGSFDTCSLNHYAYGAVGTWLYETVAGISALAPGYKKILIAPHPGGGLTWVKASYICRYGKIISEWKIKDHKWYMHVVIPENTSAIVYVPGQAPKEMKSGEYYFTNVLNNKNFRKP